MTVTDRERRDIYTGLEVALGPEVANNLMQLLPQEPANQLVTRDDMNAFGTSLRGEMAELRGELSGEMAELRGELTGEMADLRSELRGDMSELRAELKGDMSELRAELKGDMSGLRAELKGEMAELRGDVRSEVARLETTMTGFRSEVMSHTTRVVVGGAVVNVAAVLAAVGLT